MQILETSPAHASTGNGLPIRTATRTILVLIFAGNTFDKATKGVDL